MTNGATRAAPASRLLGALAALLGGLGVAAGAVAAHGFGADPRAQALMSTASAYAVWHALAALLAIGRGAVLAGGAFLLGILLFSGSIASGVLGGPSQLGALAPFGGVLLMAGWAALAWSFAHGRGALGPG